MTSRVFLLGSALLVSVLVAGTPGPAVAGARPHKGGPYNQTRSDLVASSLDGGKTWKRRTIPGLTACTGGSADAGATRGWRPAATAPCTSAV